jgi:hypothetical protein
MALGFLGGMAGKLGQGMKKAGRAMSGAGGGGGVSTAPSGGFFKRLGGQIPGMTNAMAQNFGGGDAQTMQNLQGSAKLLGMQKPPMRKPPMPSMGPGISGMPQGMPGEMPPMQAQAPGLQAAPGMGPEMQAQMPITTGPSNLAGSPYGNLFGGGRGMPGMSNGNTGVAGGIFNRPPGYERPNFGGGGNDVSGLFGSFNRFNQGGRRY